MAKRNWRNLAVLAALIFADCAHGGPKASATMSAACALTGRPELIAQDDVSVHELWELPDAPVLWSTVHPDSAALRHYEAAVRARTAVTPRTVMTQQLAVYAGPQTSASLQREAVNTRQVLDGKVGRIAPASCLEQALFVLQTQKFPMFEHPTEFAAFVLRKGTGSAARVRLYVSSMSRIGGHISHAVTERVATDSTSGWEVVAHLHNHPFMFDRQVGDRMWTTEATKNDIGGGLAPSINDVHFYRESLVPLGLGGAWVTNGFDTLHLTAAELAGLQSAD